MGGPRADPGSVFSEEAQAKGVRAASTGDPGQPLQAEEEVSEWPPGGGGMKEGTEVTFPETLDFPQGFLFIRGVEAILKQVTPQLALQGRL